MKARLGFVKIMAVVLGLGACDSTKKDKADYEIASPVYAILAEKSLDYLAGFELDAFAEMLADSVEYELPDGTKLMGKMAVINYWKSYQITAGIQSMRIVNATYLPVETHTAEKTTKRLGTKVVIDLTNEMVLKHKNTAVKMNFCLHFNQEKLIDHIDSNYDQTLITLVSHKSILSL
ncbi:hypothetical protein [Runella aurantiaca]|uniref:Nuclear transport factor 2 family protein n=1 Tax=Runella aurantiaca TaxID=2282308 RepID=A0A369ICN0_9BACT|nr:hypothetical protein [Runella aurantiaca]RDB07418.1 hypothetical protein DVG78_05295 [Runella aurantiaca]